MREIFKSQAKYFKAKVATLTVWSLKYSQNAVNWRHLLKVFLKKFYVFENWNWFYCRSDVVTEFLTPAGGGGVYSVEKRRLLFGEKCTDSPTKLRLRTFDRGGVTNWQRSCITHYYQFNCYHLPILPIISFLLQSKINLSDFFHLISSWINTSSKRILKTMFSKEAKWKRQEICPLNSTANAGRLDWNTLVLFM